MKFSQILQQLQLPSQGSFGCSHTIWNNVRHIHDYICYDYISALAWIDIRHHSRLADICFDLYAPTYVEGRGAGV